MINQIQIENNIIAAIYKDDYQGLKKILKKTSYDVNFIHGGSGYKSRQLPPICIAASKGYIDIVRLLIKYGADINKQSAYFETALIIASYRGFKKLVIFLLKNGADPTIKDNSKRDFIKAADRSKASDNPQNFKIRRWLESYDTQKYLLDRYTELYYSFKDNKMLHPVIAIDFDFIEKGSDLGLL